MPSTVQDDIKTTIGFQSGIIAILLDKCTMTLYDIAQLNRFFSDCLLLASPNDHPVLLRL